jgi:phosphoserine aminotransferase
VEDYLDALKWAEGIGGLDALIARSEANLTVIEKFVAESDTYAFLAETKDSRSNTSVCLKFADASLDAEAQGALAKKVAELLEKEGVALDAGAYRDAPPGLRIWCGATVDTADVAALMPWLDWAYAKAKSS